jgi:1-aminocyclopropane-1-carboxylate deaminase
MAQYVPPDSSHVVMAVGTGATLTGLRQALPDGKRVWGVKVVEASQENSWISNHSRPVEWVSRFTFGSYARTTPDLIAFVGEWNRQTGIPIEPIYTGKLLFGVIRMMEEGELPSGPETVVIHTGGLQYLSD